MVVTPKTAIQSLQDAGVDLSEVIGVWHAPIRRSWFVSLGDWASEKTAAKIRGVLGPRVIIEDEAVPDRGKFPIQVKGITTKPFASRAQWKKCFQMNDPRWDCHKWAHETPGGQGTRYRKLPIKKKEDSTSNSSPSGAIVGFWLPKDVAERVHQIAVEALGEDVAAPADELHITLQYLGEVEDLQDQAGDLMMSFLNFGKDLVSNLEGKSLSGTIGGVGRFFGGEEKTPVYLSISSQDLTQARHLYDEELEEFEIEPDTEHGFVPHVTIGYISKNDPMPAISFEPFSVNFDTVYLAFGEAKLPFPLTESGRNDFFEDNSVEVKSLRSLLSLKGERLAQGITRIRGDICNVHGRWGSCSAAGFGQVNPKDLAKQIRQSRSPGVKPIKYGVPQKGGRGGKKKGGRGGAKKGGAGGREKIDRSQQELENRKKVIDQMAQSDQGLAPASAQALLDFFDGKDVDQEFLKGLSTVGLTEVGRDGQYRLTPSGRAAALSMGRGDMRGTLDAVSRGSDNVAAQQERSQQGGVRGGKKSPIDVIAGQLEKQTPKKPAGGGSSSSQSKKPVSRLPSRDSGRPSGGGGGKGGGGGGGSSKPPRQGSGTNPSGGIPIDQRGTVPPKKGSVKPPGTSGGAPTQVPIGQRGTIGPKQEDQAQRVQRVSDQLGLDPRITDVLSNFHLGQVPTPQEIESGGWARAGLFTLNPSTQQYDPTPMGRRLLTSAARGDAKTVESILSRARETLRKTLSTKAVWSGAFVNDLPDSAFLFIESGGEKDEAGKTSPRSLRHLPYRGTDGKIDLPHLRNALARIPQMNARPGLDRNALMKKARSLLMASRKERLIDRGEKVVINAISQKRGGITRGIVRRGIPKKTDEELAEEEKAKRRPGSKGMISEGSITKKKSFFVYKQANGQYRWVLYTSNPYKDRDEEYVTAKALRNDVDRWWAEGRPPTPLRWWHFGRPRFQRLGDWTTVVAGPGADLGTCDFRALHEVGEGVPILVESGTFKSARVGRAISRHADELEGSLGFAHPPTEPDEDGGFLHIKSFERSLTPLKQASNLYTAFLTQATTMKENHMDADKLEALRNLGVDVDEVLEGAERIQRKARSNGTPLRMKSYDGGEDDGDGDLAARLDSLTSQLTALQEQLKGDAPEPEEKFEDLLVSELTVGELQGVLNSTVSTKAVEPMGQALQVVFEELQEIKELLTSKSVQSVVDEVARMKAKIERLSARTKGIGGKVRELEDTQPRVFSRGVRPSESETTFFDLEDETEVAQKSRNGSENGPFGWLDDFVTKQ